MNAETPLPDALMLWIDQVGGYWMCLGDSITFGRAGGGKCDVPLLADVASCHARVRREGELYLLDALRETRVDGRAVRGSACLSHGNRVQLGGVELQFQQPSPLSATARLDFLSPRSTQPLCDAILLLADACILGPRSQSHVVCRPWETELVLYRQGGGLFARSAGQMSIDGKPCEGQGRVGPKSRLEGEAFSLTLEPVKPPADRIR